MNVNKDQEATLFDPFLIKYEYQNEAFNVREKDSIGYVLLDTYPIESYFELMTFSFPSSSTSTTSK